MSEFTDGILVLKGHVLPVQAALADLTVPYIFKEVLDERWSGIFLEEPNIRYDPAWSWLLRHSKEFPILSFWDAEDHGWGYNLFYDSQEKASVNVNYDIHYGFWRRITGLLYPDIDPHVDLDPSVSGEINHLIYTSDGYQWEIEEQYAHAHVEEFASFGLPSNVIEQLGKIVCSESYRNLDTYLSHVDRFKEAMGIRAMSWKSYRYIMQERNEGYDT